MLDDGGWIRRQEELSRHRGTIVGKESTRLGSVQQRLIGRREQVVGFGESGILRCPLGRESRLLGIFDVDKVHLHLLLRSDADDKRRTLACRDDLVRVVDGLEQETEGSLKFLDDSLGKDGEFDVGMLVIDVLG